MALYVVLEQTPEDIDPNIIDGKALNRAEPELAKVYAQAGVTPLMDFFSISADEVHDFFADEEDFDPAELDVPPRKWFPARDGLATVRALREHLEKAPDTITDSDLVLNDLRKFEQVLSAAAQRGIGWHLAIDV